MMDIAIDQAKLGKDEMMKILVPLLAALLAATPGVSEEKSEGRQLAELAFDSVDSAGRNFIDMGEFTQFGLSVFAGMDYDDSQLLTLSEFMSWDFGMKPLAEKAGRAIAYDTALRVVFAFWDRNGDNEISKMEFRQSMTNDFQRADVDGDAILSKDEFTLGYSVMVAMRSAINPAPIQQ